MYLCPLLLGEALCDFETLYTKIGHTNTVYLNHIMLGIGVDFSMNALSK